MAYRVPQAIYQAHRIRQLTHGIDNPSVLEIGGGLGRTAFYARQLGITDYTIVDLPLSSLSQGNFLGRVLGPEQVAVLGEPEINEESRTKLVSPAAFLGSQRRYDLVVNIDSMTEMSREVATAYIRHISANADRFLSINHESNPFTVRELLLEQKLARPVPRTPYPMRDGYVEEIALLG
jgi:putative sugar O-methyltransferase